MNCIEDMTIENLDMNQPPEVKVNLNMVTQLSRHPDAFRFCWVTLPADIRLHAKYALLKSWSGYSVCNITMNQFTEDVLHAIHEDDWISRLTNHYLNCDILLLDDVQFITARETTQQVLYSCLLKPRLEAHKVTVMFSEYDCTTTLTAAVRDDLNSLLRLAMRPETIC